MKEITMNTSKEISIQEAFEKFIRKCKIKNLSPNSIESYRYKLKKLVGFVGQECLCTDITSDTIDDYIISLREEHIAEVSLNTYLVAARALLYFCMQNGYMPTFKIHLVKVDKPIKPTYSDADLQKLLKKPNVSKINFTEYKTWVFENYLLGTGNRISTALNVKIEDIDFENNLISLRQVKNRRQQIIPLSRKLAGILKEYLEIRKGSPEEYLFCDNYGNKAEKRRYQYNVQHYNLNRNVALTSCHAFRHTFAKMWVMNNGDVFRLQKMMGHSTISVTKEYVDMFGTDLQKDFEKFNPLDTMEEKKQAIHIEI